MDPPVGVGPPDLPAPSSRTTTTATTMTATAATVSRGPARMRAATAIAVVLDGRLPVRRTACPCGTPTARDDAPPGRSRASEAERNSRACRNRSHPSCSRTRHRRCCARTGSSDGGSVAQHRCSRAGDADRQDPSRARRKGHILSSQSSPVMTTANGPAAAAPPVSPSMPVAPNATTGVGSPSSGTSNGRAVIHAIIRAA